MDGGLTAANQVSDLPFGSTGLVMRQYCCVTRRHRQPQLLGRRVPGKC
jgi:hypothetical protein